MTSRAEAIADAVFVALTAPPMTSVPAARVFRDLEGAVQAELLPAIAVETGDEPPPVRNVIGHKQRRVDIDVTVIAAGCYAAADAVLIEAFGRLVADPSLGGLAFELEEGATRRQRQDGERHLVAVTKTWSAQYRTAENSLEA
jgi:hypothetical protein